jgi:hypothetical protein
MSLGNIASPNPRLKLLVLLAFLLLTACAPRSIAGEQAFLSSPTPTHLLQKTVTAVPSPGELVLATQPSHTPAASPTRVPLTSTPSHTPVPTFTATETPLPTLLTLTETPSPTLTVRFAVIGDYGLAGKPAADVAGLVKSWDPDLILTTGDNNYPIGSAETIDENVGQYYHEFIYPYKGSYGPGADINRFFPTLGNHDYGVPGARPYLEYFTLPGNGRYYDFVWGPVHFFA